MSARAVNATAYCEVCGRAFKPWPGQANRFCSPDHYYGHGFHTPEFIGRARALWHEGLSTAKIGRKLGVSKNVIVGVAHRNEGFPARPSPIRRKELEAGRAA